MLKISTIFKNKTLFIIAIFMALSSSKMYADTPSAPIWLNYTGVTHDTTKNVFSVDLEWRHGEVTNENPLPDSYNIYRVLFGHSEDKFKLVGTLTHNANELMQLHTDENITDGAIYLYYVTAVKDGKESDESKRMTALVPGSYCVNTNAEIIDFKSNPSTIGVPGESYEYNAFAKHRSLRVQGLVRYALEEGPEGMKMDNETGLLTWDIPVNSENEYYVKIKATSEDDKNALSEQEWYIRIASQTEIMIMSSVENAVKDLSIYPIPAQSNIKVEFDSDFYSNNIEIFDNLGNVVYSTNLKSNLGFNTYDLNISNFANGLYTLRISNVYGVSTKKLIINK